MKNDLIEQAIADFKEVFKRLNSLGVIVVNDVCDYEDTYELELDNLAFEIESA